MTKQIFFFQMKIYYTTTNMALQYINHSANLCLSILTDKNLKRFDKGFLIGMILIDLQKTFDTIDHEILFQKLKTIRFSKGTCGLDIIFLSEYFLLILNVSSQILEIFLLGCHKGLS